MMESFLFFLDFGEFINMLKLWWTNGWMNRQVV